MSNAGDAGSMFGPIYEDVRYVLDLHGVEAEKARVVSFIGSEQVSELFHYRILVASNPEDVPNIIKARGFDASFTIERDGKPLHVARGVVTEARSEGAGDEKYKALVEIVLEPTLARLGLGRDLRIFQAMSASDIVTKILKDERIECVWRVRPDPRKRDYCTQFGESDLDFVRRLAAEEGASFYFEDDGEKTVVVFAGDNRGFKEVSPDFALPFNDGAGGVTKDHVRSIAATQPITVGAFEHRAYDYKNPGLAHQARKESKDDGALASRAHHEYPGTFIDAVGGGDPYARMRLEELRSRALTLEGAAYCLRLSAGRSFTLKGHPDTTFNRKLLVTRVTHQGSISGAVREVNMGATTALSAFDAVPAETPIHPPWLPKPTPHLQVAKVVGPSAGSPHVDSLGRIKIQFFWDREGKSDEHSSCWVRQTTLAAYADEGFWTAHKVGSEVVVDFVDGDIDQPLLVGAVFNGRNKQPNKQPGEVSRSTWKVRGIPGGTGYNEITLECQAGAEQIIVHAQKDLNETVLHSHTEKIGANQTSVVGGNQALTVGADRTASVGNNETLSINANQSSTIGGDRAATVAGNESLAVVGSATKEVLVADTVLVGGVRSLTAGSEAVTVGARTKTVATSETTTVGGSRTETVGGDESITIGGARSVTVTGAESLQTDATIAMTAKEAFQAQAGDDAMFSMNKDGEILIKSGDSSILLKKNGQIAIKGKELLIDTDSKVEIKSSDVKMTGDDVEMN
jgi:type VI secretion system secreted protein VgrG